MRLRSTADTSQLAYLVIGALSSHLEVLYSKGPVYFAAKPSSLEFTRSVTSIRGSKGLRQHKCALRLRLRMYTPSSLRGRAERSRFQIIGSFREWSIRPASSHNCEGACSGETDRQL